MSLMGRGKSRVKGRTAAIAMLALCAGHAALAPMAVAQNATYPVPGPGDPRIKEFMYDPNSIVGIRGQLGYELTIEFGADEYRALALGLLARRLPGSASGLPFR